MVVGSEGRVTAMSKSVNSLEEHQSANITARHSSMVHSTPLDQHNPCYSVEVAKKTQNTDCGLNRNHSK